jgi:plasmid rolling circle replication initiator protein Rep
MAKEPVRMLYGKGVALTDKKAVQRRARCKLITQTTMLRLIDVAKEKGATDRVKAYWNTYHCQNLITTAKGRMYATHCKNRFCTYCCGIRKAELINQNLPVIRTWKDPHFLTLTTKAVGASKLKARIRNMNRAFRIINDRYRQKAHRGTGPKLVGLKSLECNFNPKAKTYNPHFHLIVPDKETADILLKEWLNLWTTEFAKPVSQNCRKVKDREKDLIEVIKYEAKIITEPDGTKSRGKKAGAKIYARALDNIYAAMKGIRIIDRFGFNAPPKVKTKTEYRLTEDSQLWQYHLKSRDWVSEESEGTLTNYSPDFELENLIELNIDTDAE